MTNQEILEKAIQKAIDGGWNFDFVEVQSNPGLMVMDNAGVKYTINDIIFNQNFAKALWKKDNFITTIRFGNGPLAYWQYNLAQMVLAPDPIAYLGKNI